MLRKIILEYEKHLKGKKFKITLETGEIIEFQIAKKRLKHLLGFQYTSYSTFPAELIYSKIKNRKLTLEKLQKDKKFKIVETRIINFTRIIDLLSLNETDFIIEFNKTLIENCELKSKYIIYKDNSNHILHLGLAEDNIYYPETWFIRDERTNNIDLYIKNQKKIKVIKFEIITIN
ncbi:MAG: PBECR4 domain-containing protein [Cetobacterium sp.]|uniref:PBECR4 domain-containing protein n=1 Tax=Cetobacterium sp. TaxID=2071632 RepID=UPI003F40E79E